MQTDSFEDRLRSLAARGFGISVSVNRQTYGEHKDKVLFNVALRKGESYGTGMEARGNGFSFDEAARDALNAAAGFLGDHEPPAAVRGALGDMVANLLPAE